jgi:hypothetical protein
METIEDVLHKDMTRQEFLATLGFGIASLLGVGTVLRFLLGKHTQGSIGRVNMGYGASIYGGRK